MTKASTAKPRTGSKQPSTRPASGRLPRTIVAAADASKILGIRAGRASDHRFVGVWPIVIDGRLFARSWTVKPTGWFHTFLDDPHGAIQVGEREIRVRARRVTSKSLLDRIERAYAEKYPTPGSRRYVVGFRTPRRRSATIEFVARS
jgi:hypothetical protein